MRHTLAAIKARWIKCVSDAACFDSSGLLPIPSCIGAFSAVAGKAGYQFGQVFYGDVSVNYFAGTTGIKFVF